MSDMSEENVNRESESGPLGEPFLEETPPMEMPPLETPPEKQPRKISLTAFVCSAIALVVATAVIVSASCFFGYRKRIAELGSPEMLATDPEEYYYPFELISAFFDYYSMTGVDKDAMLTAALKAYVYATGDRYAAYYTEEEAELLNDSKAGDSEGIGINIIEDETVVSGVSYKVLRVINVMEGSPALAAGVRLGDMICAVGIGDDAETVSSLGYDVALSKLQGASGTDAEFLVFRGEDEGVQILEFKIRRGTVTTTSVRGQAVSLQDKKVGVIKIFRFDSTTPTQFKSEMNRMIAEGCSAFVYDVRDNPGGWLLSIEAVLSYFLEEGDTIIITRDNQKNESVSKVRPVTYWGTQASCSVKREEIGMYRDYPAVVLCNENTASAGELFTAAFRDYELAPIVGMNTYGKGTMQQFFDLSALDYEGTLRLTIAMYYPPCDESYDGVGIMPDHVVEPSEELWTLNSFEVDPSKDNQLQKALSLLQVKQKK